MAINPIVFTKKIIDSFLKYQMTTYPFEDIRLNKQMKNLLSGGVTQKTPLLQGPFVSLSQTFKQGCSVKSLCDEGILHPHLQDIVPYKNKKIKFWGNMVGKTIIFSCKLPHFSKNFF